MRGRIFSFFEFPAACEHVGLGQRAQHGQLLLPTKTVGVCHAVSLPPAFEEHLTDLRIELRPAPRQRSVITVDHAEHGEEERVDRKVIEIRIFAQPTQEILCLLLGAPAHGIGFFQAAGDDFVLQIPTLDEAAALLRRKGLDLQHAGTFERHDRTPDDF